MMDAPYQAASDVPRPAQQSGAAGRGRASRQRLRAARRGAGAIDTGIGTDGEDFIDALSSIIDPAALRWVWLTHDDADHTGNIQRVFELAPDARLATNAFSALRMAT